MGNRSDQLVAQRQQMQRRFTEKITNAPAASNVLLHTASTDDATFIGIASRLITAAAAAADLSLVYAVHIDNWFGPRWLGFCGKTRGIAGVRNRTLKRSLSVPPFHPHRVLSARGHYRREDGLYAHAEEITSLHPHIPSEVNIYRSIRGRILHAWYSGNTTNSGKGVVMVYYRLGDNCKAFYTMFNRDRGWDLDQHIGITRPEVAAMLETENCWRAT